MDSLPLKKNTAALTVIALLAALGTVARFAIRITVIPEFLDVTPGFMFSELGGIIGGLPGGIITGLAVGLGAVIAGTEIPLVPLMGNVFLGIGSGYAIYLTQERNSLKYAILVIIGSGIIGGFIPDMTIFLFLSDTLELALLVAISDMIQAFAWAVCALLIERKIIRPIAGQYLYPEFGAHELEEEGISE